MASLEPEVREALETLARNGDLDAIAMLKELGLWTDSSQPRAIRHIPKRPFGNPDADLLTNYTTAPRPQDDRPAFDVQIGDGSGAIRYVIVVRAQDEEEARRRAQSELKWMNDVGNTGWCGLPNPPSMHILSHKIIFDPSKIEITNVTRRPEK